MPTYTVTSVEGCLHAPERAKIASEITRIQSDVQDAMNGVDAAGACRRAFELDQQVTDALRKTKASVVPT